MLQKGHSETVNEVIMSPSGRQMISCSNDKTIKIWDVASGKEMLTLVGHKEPVKSLAIDREGKTIFSGGSKKESKVFIWEARSGSKKGELSDFEGEITSIKFSKYGNRIAVLESLPAFASRVSVWDEVLAAKRFDIKLPDDFGVNTIAFHPGNNHLLIGGKYLKKKKTESILLYSSDDGKLLQELTGTSTNVVEIVFSEKGNKMVALGTNIQIWYNAAGTYVLDQTIEVNASHALIYDEETKVIFSKGNDLFKWDLDRKIEVGNVNNAHLSAITSISATTDGNNFVTSANDPDIYFWDESSLSRIPHFTGLKPDRINALAFNWNYKQLFTGVDGQNLQYWDVEKARLDFVPAEMSRKSLPSHIANAPDKHEVLICGDQNKGVEIWNTKENRRVAYLNHTSFVSNAEAIPNSSIIVGIGRDRKVLMWDQKYPDNAPEAMTGHTSTILSLTVSPDGKTIFTGGKDKTIMVWSVAQKTLTYAIKTDMPVNSLAVSPDGTLLASGCGTTGDVFESRSPTALYLWETSRLGEYATAKSILARSLVKHNASVSKVLFSSDGQKIFSAGADNQINVWSKVGQHLKTLSGHSADVTALALSKQDQYLLSGSQDATIRYWDVDKASDVFSTVTFDNGTEYINYDQNNYYACTKNGAKNVHFVQNGQVFLFEQFDLRLNRPDLVYANLPGVNPDLLKAYNKAYQKRLRKMGFTESMLTDNFNIPTVEITNGSDYPYQVTERTVTLNIKAKDAQSRLDRINVWINDVPIYGQQGIDLRNKNIQSLETELPLELSVGKNKVQISVLNQNGAESLKATKFIYYQSAAKKNDLYVVGIGVSKFVSSEYNLDYAAKDATDVVDYFKRDASKYNTVHTRLITNEQATKENIKDVKNFLSGSKIDDNVIVFVASHGLLDDQLDYYLATTNVNFQQPRQNGLVYEDLEGILDGIPARKKLLLIDACHSGEVDADDVAASAPAQMEGFTAESAPITGEIKSRGFKRMGGSNLGMASTFELMKEMFNDLRRGSGATVISSAGGKEFALESSKWNNGVFTYCFLEGLESGSADVDGDSKVDISEIRNYVADNVKKLTNGQQNPTFRKENLDNNYDIW